MLLFRTYLPTSGRACPQSRLLSESISCLASREPASSLAYEIKCGYCTSVPTMYQREKNRNYYFSPYPLNLPNLPKPLTPTSAKNGTAGNIYRSSGAMPVKDATRIIPAPIANIFRTFLSFDLLSPIQSVTKRNRCLSEKINDHKIPL